MLSGAANPATGTAHAVAPMRNGWAWALVVLTYTGTALALAYPGVLAFTHAALGLPGDLYQNLWNVLWVRGWLSGHHALYFTRLEYYPTGANLAWETLSLPGTVVAALLSRVIGLVAAYNTALLAYWVADGLAMYVFACTVGLPRVSAWLAGLAFMASPYFVGQMMGHLHLVGAFGVPLFLSALWKLYERPRASVGRYLVLAGLLALTTYVVQDYAVYAIAVAVLLLFLHPARPWRRVLAEWRRWGVAILAYAAMVAPMVYAMLFGPLAVHAGAATPVSTPWVVNLEGLVQPEPWGLFVGLVPGWRLAPDLLDGAYFPGFVLWAAAAVLLLARQRLDPRYRTLARLAAIGTVLFAVLSLGPVLHVGSVTTAIPLPERVLASLPAWRDTWPERLAMLTALFGAILVGVAAQVVRTRLEERAAGGSERGRGRRMVVMGGLALIAAASWSASFPATAVPAVPYVRVVQDAGGTVLYVPPMLPNTRMGFGSAEYMYVEAVLNRPTPEGYVSRIPLSTIHQLNASPVLVYLWNLQFTHHYATPLAKAASSGLQAYLKRYDVHSVIFLAQGVARPQHAVAWLRQHLGRGWPMRRYGTTRVFIRQS